MPPPPSPPHLPNPTSTSLLFRLKTQDEAAWKRFVDVYGPLVMLWIRRRLETVSLPTDRRDDVIQEVFLTVRQYIGGFDRRRTGSFRKWLRSIVHSRVVDAYRTSQRGERNLTEAELDALHLIPEPGDDEAERTQERIVLLQSIVETLRRDVKPNTYRIMEATMIGDRPDAEVAAELGMDENAVRQARIRIKKRIRDEFGELFEEDGMP